MLRDGGRREPGVSFVLPVIRYGARPAPRRRPGVDLLLGVSRRRRRAAYVAIGGGLKLLQPMLRRVGLTVAFVVLLPLVSFYLRMVF